MAIGGVTPFALPAGLPLWIDAAVMERDRIVVGGGQPGRPRSSARRRCCCVQRGAPAAEVVDRTSRQAASPDTELTASVSISTFHRGSSRAATTTVVFVGRIVAEQLAVHGGDRGEVGGVDEVDADPHDVVQPAAELGERGADDLEAAPGLLAGVGGDRAVRPLRRRARHEDAVADGDGPAVARPWPRTGCPTTPGDVRSARRSSAPPARGSARRRRRLDRRSARRRSLVWCSSELRGERHGVVDAERRGGTARGRRARRRPCRATRRDVDGVGLRRPVGHGDPLHAGPRRLGELGEDPAVGGVGDGIDRRPPDGAVVGAVPPGAGPVPHRSPWCWATTTSGRCRRIAAAMSRRSSRPSTMRPSGWPRNSISDTPTIAAAGPLLGLAGDLGGRSVPSSRCRPRRTSRARRTRSRPAAVHAATAAADAPLDVVGMGDDHRRPLPAVGELLQVHAVDRTGSISAAIVPDQSASSAGGAPLSAGR